MRPGGKQNEGLPKEKYHAYDRIHPKYFIKDISKEVKDLLEKEQELTESTTLRFEADSHSQK